MTGARTRTRERRSRARGTASGTRRLRTVRATAAVGATAVALVLVLGWMVLVGPATGALGTAREELLDSQDGNRLLSARLARLEAQRQDLSAVTEVADELAVLFPPTADQPGFFRMVDRAAAAAGLAPRQVTTLSPTVPVIEATEATEAAEGGTEGSSEESTDGSREPAEGTAPAPATAVAVQSVVVTVEGTYEQGQRLLAELERLDRSFLVQSVTVSGEEARTIAITGSTFVAPLVPRPAEDG